MHQARVITCCACGGDVELSIAQPQTVCPYCRADLRLNEALRRGVQQYESAARSLIGREALARRKAAMHARAARHNASMIALAVFFSIVLTWWFLAGVTGIANKIPLGVNVTLVLVSVFVIIGFGKVWASMMKAPEDEELGAVGLAMCDNCGAFIPFKQGEALANCQYCFANALKPATLALELLQSGRDALRDGRRKSVAAEAENWRTAREARFAGMRLGATGWVVVAVVAAFGMTGAMLTLLVRSSEAVSSTWWIWVAIVLSVVAAVGMVVRAVKGLMLDNEAFERRFGVVVTAGDEAYHPTRGSTARPPPVIRAPGPG